LGIKPTVRGEAMNPIDHPHGGKTRGGVRLKTIYGKLAKFIKTR
jgi:large subunit ribosomal protein L2